MAKAKLIFDLEDHDDNLEFNMASHARGAFLSLLNIHIALTALRDESENDAQAKLLDDIVIRMNQEMAEHDIDLDWLE